MKNVIVVCIACIGGLVGCAPKVVDGVASGSGGGSEASTSSSTEDSSGGGGETGAGQANGAAPYPTPCHFLRGTATLTSWGGNQHDGSYEKSAFSFEFATQDENVTNNGYELLYEGNVFIVKLVTGNESFIVDLGDVAIESAPATVDPKSYPTGEFGGHDDIEAIAEHAYWVRSLDGDIRQVAVFRVTELAPGESVTIDWMRSLDPDTFVPPTACP